MSVPSNIAALAGTALSSGLIPSYLSTYDMNYQISPITLVGGIASSNANGGQMSILTLLGQGSVLGGNIGSLTGNADPFIARFLVVPGGTLISNVIGTYPFANQQVAANAIIQNPLNISLQMVAPVKDAGGYQNKLAIFTALQNALQQHNATGGTYNIATPAFLYTNCLMTSMQDITSGNTVQKQVEFQLDFVQPLITQQQATTAYNALYGKIAAGQQVTSPASSNNPSLAGQPAQSTSSGLSTSSVITYPISPGS